jgi:uncharacterized protein YceH (UPF0502 family)
MLELSSQQIRVLGVLLEKSITTPDQYPLSLNALTNACNQKSNREPVMSLTECDVQSIVDSVCEMKLITKVMLGGRVPKYKQRLCNTEFGDYHFNPAELSIICVLFLRGPQTPGELRTRTNRLFTFNNMQQVDGALADLISRNDGPLIVKLAPSVGKREPRYCHLFSDEMGTIEESPVSLVGSETYNEQEQRIIYLEQEVSFLRKEMDNLRQELGG